MKYLGFSESFVLYELPLARGLQYQHAILSMEGADTFFTALPEELEENFGLFEEILNQEIEEDNLEDLV